MAACLALCCFPPDICITFLFLQNLSGVLVHDPRSPDAGVADARAADAGVADAVAADVGVADAGVADAVAAGVGVADAGVADVGTADVVAPGAVRATEPGATREAGL